MAQGMNTCFNRVGMHPVLVSTAPGGADTGAPVFEGQASFERDARAPFAVRPIPLFLTILLVLASIIASVGEFTDFTPPALPILVVDACQCSSLGRLLLPRAL